MKLGKISFLSILFSILLISSKAEDKILTAPIINLEKLEPSYENLENDKETTLGTKTTLKKRKPISNS